MKKFLRTFDTEEEYLAYTASTEYYLNSVARCRQGSLVFYNPEDCGSQGIYRTISGETYCDGYDKRVYVYKQVSYDDGATWETTATTSSLVERNSEDCGYVPPTPTNWDITAKYNVTSTSSPTQIASGTTGFSKIMIDGVEQQSVISAYTFSSTGEHTVKYALKDPTSIGRYALAGCTSLTNCIISSGVTSIGNNAFRYNSNLSSIYIPNSVTSIGEASFYYCSGLTSVTIPSGITSIERSTFIGCTSLSNVNIPSGVTSIGISAFHWCSGLTSIDIPNGVTSIDSSAFSNCSGLTSVTIPDSVTSIGNNAFSSCSSLTSIGIPDSVTSIGERAFSSCSSLTSCTIGDSVTSIGGYAFRNCTSLTSIICKGTQPTIESSTFYSVNTGGTLYVPSGSSSGYNTWMKNADYYLGLYNWTKVEQ